jgi:bifunctional UDP-N-acetylglucosamine pyrophosphorylase/glucosamine-1-phosphate N-acetyltransferase
VEIGQDSVILPGCSLIGKITIGSSCSVGPHTTIEGTVHIGSNSNVLQSHLIDCQVGSDCQIGPFAHLRAGTVLADYVRIGNFVEIKKSFVGLHTNVSHLSYVGDTTVGNEANIGAGTIVANYDHITKAKCRTVIGNGVATGSNSVLVAPVCLGDDSFVAAGTVVTRDVPSGALAVGRARQENTEGWTDKRRRRSLTLTSSETPKSKTSKKK